VLVDDSEAILQFEQTVLSSHYACTTATDGAEGLAKIRAAKPAAVLLDLSMPGMSGEDVLRELQGDAATRDIPVVIVSSEKARGEACLRAGASAFLAKPIRAEDLVEIVGRALDAARSKLARAGLAVLGLGAGPLEVAIALDIVRLVTWQTETCALPSGPSYLDEFFELHGDVVCILDLARRLGVDHAVPLVDRKLVVVEQDGRRLALSVDRVRDPEEIAPHDLTAVGEAMQLDGVRAVARTSKGAIPVIDPRGLLSRGVLTKLDQLIAELARTAEAT